MNKTTVGILLIVALLIGAFGGYYYEKTKLMHQMTNVESAMQTQLNEAQAKTAQLMKAQEMMQTSPTPTGMMHSSRK